ncbi:hypothetical protein GWN63_05075 [Candidatus Bathyarchaeota archaeon]|nr:hypothetical protein [Candidatus Bathyarchaeota archaeon]NIU81598.1 hypothetical protein [Candidatus Bathyarchaeota archaeon]NIW15991.1 hypothetical protein [Candidatus Bathyarchaeota archaeon]NIW34768.1 hypothetical protein [Candidatus Bathyarchaeota archaeon]
MSAKKGIGVWIFGFLTFVAVLHTFDAYLSLTSGEASSLLRLYPLNKLLMSLDAIVYFWSSMSLAFLFLGITSVIACHNPIMSLYNRVLDSVEFAEEEVDKAVESEAGLLDMINHSLTSNSIDLHAVKKNLKSLKDSHRNLSNEISRLASKMGELESGLEIGLQRLEADLTPGRKCPFCGEQVLPQFKVCPYCGEKLPYPLIQVENL